MPSLIARLMKKDGKYHYGLTTTACRDAGQLYGITISGGATIKPPGTDGDAGATQQEHDEWIAKVKTSGGTVEMNPIDEPE